MYYCAFMHDALPPPSFAMSCYVCHEKAAGITGNHGDRTLIALTEARLAKADAEIAAQRWDAANKLLEQALAELGDSYICPGIIDETGLKLMAADIQEKEGKPDNAARARRKMLAARLDMLKAKPYI